jgi:hypothetical protein
MQVAGSTAFSLCTIDEPTGQFLTMEAMEVTGRNKD